MYFHGIPSGSCRIGMTVKILIGTMTMAGLLIFQTPVFAEYGLEETAKAAEIPMGKSITTILGDIIGTALSLVSVLFFGLMLYAGIKWMLARGDEGEATKSLDTIVAAIIGLVVVLASFAITTFVFKNVGGGSAWGGGGEAPAPKNECEKYYGDKGYACTEVSKCTKADYAADYSTVKQGNLIADKPYIAGLCPGTVFCCKP